MTIILTLVKSATDRVTAAGTAISDFPIAEICRNEMADESLSFVDLWPGDLLQ
jgi:hypothetical protein